MSQQLILQLAIEGVMILTVVFAFYWKGRVDAEHRFTKIEEMVKTLFKNTEGLSDDHKEVNGKVDRLMRDLATLRGSCVRFHGAMEGHFNGNGKKKE